MYKGTFASTHTVKLSQTGHSILLHSIVIETKNPVAKDFVNTCMVEDSQSGALD